MGSMAVQHNISSMNVIRQMDISSRHMAKSTEKLSSGYTINQAGDGATELSMSEKMRAQIRGLNQGSANAQNGISMIQTAEGALSETHSIIQRMRELAVQASSDTNTQDDRSKIQDEINQLTSEIDRIANTTEFNTKKLLNGEREGVREAIEGKIKVEGTFANSNVEAIVDLTSRINVKDTDVIRLTVKDSAYMSGSTQINAKFFSAESLFGTSVTITSGNTVMIDINGAKLEINNANELKAGDSITISLNKAVKENSATDPNEDGIKLQIGSSAGHEMQMRVNSMKSEDLKISRNGEGLNVTNQTNASMAIEAYDMAIQKVSQERAKMGAVQNRLEHTILNLETAAENLQTAESRIRDTDMAKEITVLSKNNIIQHTGQSMLVQSSLIPAGVLTLLEQFAKKSDNGSIKSIS